MKTKSLVLIFVLSGIGLIATLLFTIIIPKLGSKISTFPLPDTSQSKSSEEEGNIVSAGSVELTVSNVQNVIATLKRPQAYSRAVAVESFWGSSGNATYNFSVAVLNGMTSIRNTAASKTVIIRDGKIYIKYAGDPSFTALGETGKDDDEYQMIPTYEDILDLAPESIILAELRSGDSSEDPLIYIAATSGILGYKTEYLISVRLGLLVAATVWDGDSIVRRVTAGACDRSEPDSALFFIE